MVRLTMRDNEEYSGRAVLVNEEERLLSAKGFIDKDEMYKIMMHLAEKLCDYEDAEEQGLLLRLPYKEGTEVFCIASCEETCDDADSVLGCLGNCKHKIVIPMTFDRDMVEQFGKTVFLAREDAEKKLEEEN